MLARQQRLIQGVTNQSEMGVQYQEVTHLQSCFSLMATTAALLAGFEFTVFTLETESVGEYSKEHISTISFMVMASISLALNLGVVCMSTLAAMMGPGLALRGPDGSVRVALDNMRDEYRRVSDVFILGIYTFFAMAISLVWFEFQYIVAAPVSFIMLIAAISMAILSDRLKIRFAVPNDPYAPRRSLTFWRRPSLANLGPNAMLAAAAIDSNVHTSFVKCTKCQTLSSETADFCAKCGTKIQKKGVEEHSQTRDIETGESSSDRHITLSSSFRDSIFKHAHKNEHSSLSNEQTSQLIKRGILLKRGKNLRKRSWFERFFEVSDGALTYWDRDEKQLLRSVLLAGVALKCEPINGSALEDQAILADAPTDHVFALTLKHCKYRIILSAPTAEEMTAWIIAISRNSNQSYAPRPKIQGTINARLKPKYLAPDFSGGTSSSLSMHTYDASLTCSLLTLSRKNIVEHYIQIAKAEHWDGKGHLRHYDYGILVTSEDGHIWQLQAHSPDEYRRWLSALIECVNDHDDHPHSSQNMHHYTMSQVANQHVHFLDNGDGQSLSETFFHNSE